MSLFLLPARTRGGVRAYYVDVETRLATMVEDRGYHFIESQSHFPQHRLPEDLRVDQDDSDRPRPRPISVVDPKKASCAPQGPVFEKLLRLKRSAGMYVALVPYYFRLHEVAEAPSNRELRRRLARYEIAVHGPDYFRFSNRHFSDAVHLNADGASLYTRRLADLLSETLSTDSENSQTADN